MSRLIDTTLREGDQAPDVHLSPATKKNIFAGLTETGVDEIELGIATVANSELIDLCNYTKSNFPGQPFSLWSRCREDDINFAATLKPAILSLSMPASDLHLTKKLGHSRDWAVSQAVSSIRQALSLGIRKVALGLEDASRASPDFLKEISRRAREAGAFRVRLADTVGVADPEMVEAIIKPLIALDLEIGVHFHNDFGMATANTINAFSHGAKWGDVTILGLGERAGNSRLEEVAAYLHLKKGKSNYKLKKIVELCQGVAREIDREIAAQQPLLGSDIFYCKSGIHQHGIDIDPSTYEPFDPEIVGRERKFLIGTLSGRHGLGKVLKQMGLAVTDEKELQDLWLIIRKEAARRQRPLNDHELLKLLRNQSRLLSRMS